uniref:serine-rich protein n=1 Tax=Lachnoclostridium phocaeense TaxID=1871021 RepID=UPI0026DCEAC1
LEYLCYELEVMNPDTGERTHFYKAIKLARVIRVPANAKQSTSFMDMQMQILSGVHERGLNMVTIIANVIKPVAIGLLYLYGVQGVSEDLEEAKQQAHYDFLGLIGMLQGTFRVLEVRVVEAQEAEWLREKMYNMDYLTVVRGIPKASKAGEDPGNRGIGGQNLNPDSQGTLEEIISGMADYEYVLEVLSTPVYMDTLMGWQRQSQKEMTEWYGQLQGTKSISMNLSIPMMYMANASQSQGWSRAFTDADTVSYAQGENFSMSEGQSVGESFSQSFGRTVGHTEGATLNNSVSHGISQSEGVSFGETLGQSHGTNEGASANLGATHSQGDSYGVSQNETEGLSMGQNYSQSEGYTQGSSYNLSHGQNVSQSHNVGQSQNMGYSLSESVNFGNSASHGQNVGSSLNIGQSEGYNYGQNYGFSQNQGVSQSYSESHTESEGSSTGGSVGGSLLAISGNVSHSSNESTSDGESTSQGVNSSWGSSYGGSFGHNLGTNISSGTSRGESVSMTESMGYGQSFGQNYGFGVNESYGTSIGESLSEGWGVNESISHSQSLGNSVSQSLSQGRGVNAGVNESFSQNQGIGKSFGVNDAMNYSQNRGQNVSVSQSETLGQSLGQSVSNSVSQSASESVGRNVGRNESVSQGNSYTTSNGTSKGTSQGNTGAATLGTSASMGLGPSIGYSKSYQWLDQGVKDLLELMEYQNERIKKALRGQGAFYTYVYIGCPNLDALSTAQAIAKATWQNEGAMIQPLQVIDLTETEQKHLLYHFAAFSADVTREDVFGCQEYKYCTVLLPEEYVSYTHLPRVSEGGVFSIVQDVPKFSVPSQLKGEIYMGTVLNSERFSFKNGYRTPYDYRIPEETLMHGFFTGASRSGKTVAAMRFIAELAHVRRKKTGKRLRIVAMDPKQDWRTLARFVEPERFNFHSMGNLNFRPIKINPWKIPRGVWPQLWIDGVIDIYCRAYGLLERGKQMLGDVVFELYDEAGVFEACDKPDWRETVSELSRSVNFTKIYDAMFRKKAGLEDPTNRGGRAGNDTRDAYARLLDRLSCFNREYSIERRLYGGSDGIGIDELIGDDDVTVLESKGLENTFKNFIFGVITSGFYKYALAHEGGYLAEDQYETVLVIEEANEILTGNDAAGTGAGKEMGLSGQSEFEQMLDQAAGYGLFIIAITQKIADMPSSIIANSGIIFAGRLTRPDDITVVVRAVGREERIDDRDVVKWFPRSPTGWFVCKTSRTTDFKDAEPVLVQISRLNISPPSNLELDEILLQKEAMQQYHLFSETA